MLLASHQPLFAWDALEDSPSIGTIQRLLASIPDASLPDSLRQARGHGPEELFRQDDAVRAAAPNGRAWRGRPARHLKSGADWIRR